MRKTTMFFALLAIVVMVAACGGGGAAPAPAAETAKEAVAVATAGDAAAGEALFNQQVLNGNAGCVTCHSLEAGKVLVGPSLAGLAGRAGSTVSGETAEQYLRQSIVDPNAHLAVGCNAADLTAACAAGLMPLDWQQKLSEQEINNLVAYLQTLK